MLIRHAAAFGIYLVFTVMRCVSLVFVNLNPESEQAYDFFCYAGFADFIAQCISELLIVHILWELGTNTRREST